MNKKKIKNRIHTKKRAKERFDLTINRKDYQNIVLMILNKEYIKKFKLRKENVDPNYTGYIVKYSDKLLPVVFNNKQRVIVTVLPSTDRRVDLSETKLKQVNINNKEFLQQELSKLQKRFNISSTLSIVYAGCNKYYISGKKRRDYMDNKLRSAVEMVKYFKFIEYMEKEINKNKPVSTSIQPLVNE